MNGSRLCVRGLAQGERERLRIDVVRDHGMWYFRSQRVPIGRMRPLFLVVTPSGFCVRGERGFRGVIGTGYQLVVGQFNHVFTGGNLQGLMLSLRRVVSCR